MSTDGIEYIHVFFDHPVVARLYTESPIPVRVWRVYKYDGHIMAEVQALTGNPFRHWTHGGWAYDSVCDVHVCFLHNVHDEETLEPVILWPDGDVPY